MRRQIKACWRVSRYVLSFHKRQQLFTKDGTVHLGVVIVVNSSQKSFLSSLLRADIAGVYLAAQQSGVKESTPYRIAKYLAEEKHGKKFKARVINSVPPFVFWKPWAPASSPAEFIHRSYCRTLWRERGPWDRAKLVIISLSWPFVFVLLSVWTTILNGRTIARRSGKSILRQVGEQLYASWFWGCLPPWYYTFELYIPSHFQRGNEYLHRFETKGGIFGMMLKGGLPRGASPLGDKAHFAEKCRENKLPVPKEQLVSPSEGAGLPLDLPRMDIFIKPVSGHGGTGAQAWAYKENGDYCSLSSGECIGGAALVRKLKTIGGSFIIQKRLKNHRDMLDLSNGALATIRIMTFQNEFGAYEATHALLRMAIGANRLVDNFHAGGIVSAIDMHSGQLGPASDIGLRPDVGWCDRHPDTGATISGRHLPFWSETVDLACRTHSVFAPRLVIGWDIAITDQGPLIIEGNGNPDLDMLQRAYRAPIGNTRLGEIVGHHLRTNSDVTALIGE